MYIIAKHVIKESSMQYRLVIQASSGTNSFITMAIYNTVGDKLRNTRQRFPSVRPSRSTTSNTGECT